MTVTRTPTQSVKQYSGAAEAHPIEVVCLGSSKDSNLLSIQMGNIAEDAGQDVLTDSHCVEDKQSKLEADGEFLTKEDATKEIELTGVATERRHPAKTRMRARTARIEARRKAREG